MTKRQVPALPVCLRCSAQVETDTGLCVQCLCEDLGITYRQLDYWSRMGYLHPVRLDRGRGGGAGSPRVWPAGELQVARLMGRLTAASIQPSLAAVIARKWPDVHEIAPGVFVQVRQEECRHCNGPIRRCTSSCASAPDYPLCKGWRHVGYDSQPVIGHCCEGRSINPAAEPREEEGNG